jgi:hypothetical protein
MSRATALALVLGVSLLAACGTEPSPVMPETTLDGSALETVTAAAAPAGLGTCMPRGLKEAQKGRITPGSCLFDAGLGRRSAYFETATPPAGQMLTLRLAAEFNGVWGIKQTTQDPSTGIVWGNTSFLANAPRTLAFVGSSPSQQVFVSGQDSTQSGAFQLDATVESVTYRCGVPIALEAPVTFGETLEGTRACQTTIQFSPFPEAIGKPLRYHFYNARLQPGRSYEIRIEGVTDAFNAVLTVFSGGQVRAQSVGPVPANGVRSVVVTPPFLAYYGIEVSSGQPDGNGGWATPSGAYTLTVRGL